MQVINQIPYFVAKDVCDELSIVNNRDAMNRLDDDEKATSVLPTQFGEKEMWLVNESGLYHLIFLSRKPEAKVFRRWVTEEVLPTLRRTGKAPIALPKKIKNISINGRKLYAYRAMSIALGYSHSGSLYVRKRKYPNHFMNIESLIYVSEEMAMYMATYRHWRQQRENIVSMQAILPFPEDLPLIGGGSYGN